jgi:hypothetical protein
MILEVCAGLLILACLAVIVYLLLFSKPVTIKKSVNGSEISITVKANRDIEKMLLSAGDEVELVRKNVKAGDTIGFDFQAGSGEPKLVLSMDGKTREIKI